MLSKADKDWLKRLPDSGMVKILPYDPKAETLFKDQKKEIGEILGSSITVLHMGASGMGISGQDEIDVAIPVRSELLYATIIKLKKAYGEPDSFYPNYRARFNRYRANKKIEVAVINKKSPQWQKTLLFDSYIKKHPTLLEQYKKLKEEYDGSSLKDYYAKKIEFINSITQRAIKNRRST